MSTDSKDAPPPPPPPPPPTDYSITDQPVTDQGQPAPESKSSSSIDSSLGNKSGTLAGVSDLKPADAPMVDEGQPAPDLPTGAVTGTSDLPTGKGDGHESLSSEAQDAQHLRDLGTDPATGKFRPGEAATGARIENATGVRLERAPDAEGPDWKGADGKSYDAVGNFPAKYFDQQWDNLQERIADHLDKADYVPVDVSQFTPEQTVQVKEFIGQFGPRVFIVGDK